MSGDVYFSKIKSIYESDVLFIVSVLFGIVAISILVVRMTESIVTYAMKERDWQLQEEEYNRQIFLFKSFGGYQSSNEIYKT